jgi:hypothetical protein
MRKTIVALVFMGIVPMAWAQPDPNNPVQGSSSASLERQRIAATRAQETARFDALDAECRTRFAVNDCLKTTQSQRRALMSDLRRQDAILDDRERNQRGADQIKRTEQKAQERQQKEQEVANSRAENLAAQADKQRELDDKRAANKNIATGSSAGASAPVRATSGLTPEQRAANRASLESRQAQAEKHRQELARQQSEKTGNPPSTLPVPP